MCGHVGSGQLGSQAPLPPCVCITSESVVAIILLGLVLLLVLLLLGHGGRLAQTSAWLRHGQQKSLQERASRLINSASQFIQPNSARRRIQQPNSARPRI